MFFILLLEEVLGEWLWNHMELIMSTKISHMIHIKGRKLEEVLGEWLEEALVSHKLLSFELHYSDINCFPMKYYCTIIRLIIS